MEETHNIPPITPAPEDMLNSLEGLQKASPGVFFFTRVQARLQKDEVSLWSRIAYLVAKPGFTFATLFAIFLLNAAVLLYQRSNSGAGAADQTEQLSAEDYNTTLAANSYYDENTDPR